VAGDRGGIELKGLSLKQPWAWAIFHGKDVENRTWKTNYRGRLLIHASNSFDAEGYQWLFERSRELDILLPPRRIFYKGVILGQVHLVDCVTQHRSPWFFGPYGFVLESPCLFGFATPYKGQLGIFEVPDEVIFRIKANGKV